jgi:hypothetical protein
VEVSILPVVEVLADLRLSVRMSVGVLMRVDLEILVEMSMLLMEKVEVSKWEWCLLWY